MSEYKPTPVKFFLTILVVALQANLAYFFLYKTATYLNIIYVAQAPIWGCVETCNIIGPYGIPWWLFYHLTTLWGYVTFQIIMLILDTLFLGLVWKTTGLANSLLFTVSNVFVLIWLPGNLLVFWIGGFGKRSWPISFLALATYLPVGGPLSVWMFIWNTSFIHLIPTNPVFNLLRYTLIGSWMISGLVWKLARRKADTALRAGLQRPVTTSIL